MAPSTPFSIPTSLFLIPILFFSGAANSQYYLYNITVELEKGGGQYATLIRLLETTGMADTLNNELNNTFQRITLFAPTDGAFDALPGDFGLANLTNEQQSRLINFHILPKLIPWEGFHNVTGPEQTQASGPNGPYFLDFTYLGPQQVRVDTGLVNTTFNTALNTTPPAAIYQLNVVLLPPDKFSPFNAPSSAPSSKASPSSSPSSVPPASSSSPPSLPPASSSSPASKPVPSSTSPAWSSAPKNSSDHATASASGSAPSSEHNSAPATTEEGVLLYFMAFACVALML